MTASSNPTDDSAILGILESENESEREGGVGTVVENELSEDDVLKKARDKYNMMNVPTQRKVSEDMAKLAGQIQTAETHRTIEIQQGNAHPEHQTYDAGGSPMAAAVHDYDKDRVEVASKTVRAKDDKEVTAHNNDIKKISEAIDKENEKKDK